MSHNSFELSKIVHSKEDRTHKFMSHLWSLKRSGRSNGRSPLGSCGLGSRSTNLKCLMRMELHILNVVETPKRMPFCCGHVLYSITASLSSYTHKPYHYVIFITTARHLCVYACRNICAFMHVCILCMHICTCIFYACMYVYLCMYVYYRCVLVPCICVYVCIRFVYIARRMNNLQVYVFFLL